MPQTHINHPEDEILTGNLDAISALFCKDSKISMKMDGMSLVWGTNPENGKFFVCTKAAFNKQKIRLCYDHDDLYKFFGHQMAVFEILSHCLKYLPRTENIYWGDWLGFGRTHIVQQNTLTYVFAEKPMQKLIIAPHTKVTVTGKMCDAVCEPLEEIFDDTSIIKWVQPVVDRIPPIDLDQSEVNTRKVLAVDHGPARDDRRRKGRDGAHTHDELHHLRREPEGHGRGERGTDGVKERGVLTVSILTLGPST